MIKELLDIQRKVDGVISEKIKMNFDDTLEMRKLAFKVELGELANEIGSFKYWKDSHVIDKTLVMDEWADCLAFLLSITNQTMSVGEIDFYPVGKSSTMTDEDVKYWINTNVTKLMMDKLDAYKGGLNGVYKSLYEIGMLLGYTQNELEESYKRKSEVNIQRANEGY